ncbi:hypothetical protein [Streptomyces albogriseolus]|uniref:hypothetical protein n=1 Tax=Streptomyces albogriseolus TaxID=1887 RepID=UPI00370251DF
MARRAFITSAAALTAATALLLTGCGGDDSSPDDIKGADAGSESPSASASTAPGAKRPDITLPSTFRLTFQDWKSEEPEKQAVLNDGKEELRSGYAAIIANDLDSEALVFYHTESGLSQAQQWIKTYTDKNLTVIGDLPVFDPDVVLGSGGDNAVLNYCTDESKASTRNLKSGEVEGNPPGTDPEVFYSVSMAKNEQGVWQTVSVRSERGGCQR